MESGQVANTGFRALDDRFKGGIKRGELACFSSGMPRLPHEYKSSMWMNAVRKHLENGGRVMYIAIE